MDRKVKKNYLYNLSYQIFLLIVPILVTPYVARVLGDDQTGRYVLSLSLVTYFVIFASLGFTTYGQRLIAKAKDNHEQSKFFWEILICRLASVILSIIVFLVLISLGVFKGYTSIMWILIINIISEGFNLTFYFNGREEFSKLIVRNFLIKIISIASIFIFVKTADDLNIYVLIQSLSILFSNISLILYLPKMLAKVSLKSLKPFFHLKPTLLLFIPTVAIMIYTVLDKTLIGLITGDDSENGNYQYAEQLTKLCMTVFTSLGAVMIPRNSVLVAKGDYDGLSSNLHKTLRFVLLLAIPISIGMICIADNLVPWYLGDGYNKAADLLKLLSPIILIIGVSNVLGLQCLIPLGKDKKFTIAVLIGALVNFGLNIVLITALASYGAAIATVIAEIIVTGIMFYLTRKIINIKLVFKNSLKYLIAGLIMFIPTYIIGSYLNSSILNTMILVFIGLITYLTILLILRDDLVINMIKSSISILKKVYKKIKN